MIEERRLVLRVAEATVTTDEYGGIDPITITLDIIGSDLLLLLVEQPGQGTAFADMCSGLLAPSAGLVQFLGSDWSRLGPDTSNALRGRIGRVFHAGGWINQLTLLDNILLQQLHHTRDAAEYHNREASRLAQRFGLPGVPLGRPEEFAAPDLQRAACVRAFLGQPALILLEEPTRSLAHESKARLINVIREARDSGAAVVWITVDHALWQDGSIPATRRYRWLGRRLIEVSKK
ncbi:MAG: ATP-binding cassette domain-containing protein [Desulfobacterales bacterium]|nr:MAG: ATP-binding cassette domain-containing protein [Desulfobacterales bacterium]